MPWHDPDPIGVLLGLAVVLIYRRLQR